MLIADCLQLNTGKVLPLVNFHVSNDLLFYMLIMHLYWLKIRSRAHQSLKLTFKWLVGRMVLEPSNEQNMLDREPWS